MPSPSSTRATVRRSPATAWRSSSCEAPRPAPPAQQAAEVPRARAHPRGPRVRPLGGRLGRKPPGRRGHAAAERAREDVVARVPRAARAHLLELPVELLTRPDPRALRARLTGGRLSPAPVRAAPLQHAGV